jgi:hypothetical protein
MILKSRPGKLNLPLVSAPAPSYSTPDTNSENYNKNKLPSGLESVKISTPSGYTVPSRIPPEILAKAQSLLKARASKNLPFNYSETFFFEEDGKINEYLALITLHFDNHPKRFLESLDGEKEPHPPFWHPGVSIFKKINASSLEDRKRKKKIRKEKSNNSLLEDDLTKNLEQFLEENSSSNFNVEKLSFLVEEFNNLIIKFSK